MCFATRGSRGTRFRRDRRQPVDFSVTLINRLQVSNSNLQLNQKHRMAQTNTSGSSEGHHIPWDLMKADTLRAVLRDLGVKPPAGKREDMLASLRGIEKNGCMCSTVLLLRCAYAMFISGCSDV